MVAMLDRELNRDRAQRPARHARFRDADQGDVWRRSTDNEPHVALIPNANYVAASSSCATTTTCILYVARPLDPRVVAQLRETRLEREPNTLHSKRAALGVQVAFGLMYTVIALIVLLSAVLIGLNFANRLVAPIRRLIGAANVVSTGNLHVQVPVRKSEGDLGQLGETFNRMTQDLRTQRDDLVRARDLIDSRRRFSEAVLAGASAGVIGVDHDGRISILNRSAEALIGHSEADVLGKPLVEVVPELAEIVSRRDREPPAAGARPGHDQPQGAASAICRCVSPASSRPTPNTVMLSRSTTSPNS